MQQIDAHWNRYLQCQCKLKWTKATIFAFIKIALVNSWTIGKQGKYKSVSQRAFLESLLQEFATKVQQNSKCLIIKLFNKIFSFNLLIN